MHGVNFLGSMKVKVKVKVIGTCVLKNAKNCKIGMEGGGVAKVGEVNFLGSRKVKVKVKVIVARLVKK